MQQLTSYLKNEIPLLKRNSFYLSICVSFWSTGRSSICYAVFGSCMWVQFTHASACELVTSIHIHPTGLNLEPSWKHTSECIYERIFRKLY